MNPIKGLLILAFVVAAGGHTALSANDASEAIPTFTKDVAPIL